MKDKKVTGTEILLVLLVSVILSNGEIAGTFSPFVVAFSSALGGISLGVSLVGAVVGFAFFGKMMTSLNYIVVILFLCALEILSASLKWKISPLKKATLTGVLMLVSDILIAPWSGFEIGRIAVILAGGALCGVLSFYFNYLKTKTASKDWIRPTAMQYAALSVTFLAAVTALSAFDIWIFNAGRIFGILAVTLVGRRSVKETAVCGALVTAGVALGNYEYAQSCIFIAVSAIVFASLFEYGKLKAYLLFSAFNFFSMLTVGVNIYSVGFFIDSLVAVLISVFIKYSPETLKGAYSSSEYACEKLLCAADAVEKVEDSINKVASVLDKKTAKNTDWIYEKASGVVCRNCDKNMYCWQENYDRTANAMCLAVKEFDKKTTLNTSDLPDYLKMNCPKNAEFLSELNGFYNSYLADSRATRKLMSQRKIMLNQLELAREMFIKVGNDLVKEQGEQQRRFDVEIEVASKPASGNVSGDCYNTFYSDDGVFYFCLFDGMGKGKRAALDSNFLSKVVTELMGTGIEMNTVMKTANDCMLVKSGDESFSTADIIKIDLKNGKTEIIKAGSAPTYFISKGKATKIATKTFPLGMFSGVQTEKTEICADANDIFVLSSDGAGDILKILESSSTTNTEILAENLYEQARKNNEKNADDISIAVIKLKKFAKITNNKQFLTENTVYNTKI